MKQYFNLAFHSLKNHGIKTVSLRFIKFLIVKFKRLLIIRDRNNVQRWSSIKGKYNGKRVFVLGNGPSLNETPLYLLKDEFKICFNHFHLMFPRVGWKPNFYMVTDDMVIRDIPKEFIKNFLPNIDMCFFPDIHPNNTDFRKYIPSSKNVYWMHNDYPEFSDNLPKCGINRTVVNAAIQVMVYLGFTEIYLLGVDASYNFKSHKVRNLSTRDLVSEEDDTNHFDPRYFGRGKKYHFQPMDEMVRKFEVAKEFFSKRKITIINSGVGGELEVFKRKPLLEVLEYTEKKQFEIFNILIAKYLQINLTELLKNEHLKSAEKIDEDCEYFLVDKKMGLGLVPKLINSHIALGPYLNKYIFINKVIRTK